MNNCYNALVHVCGCEGNNGCEQKVRDEKFV